MLLSRETLRDDEKQDLSRSTVLCVLPVLLAVHFISCLYGSRIAYTGNFDSGTVGLMAVNIAQGADFPLFWYGQIYFGALESYVAALMIKLFGFSELKMTLAPILFSQVWIVGTYFLYREISGRKAGLIAALVTTFPGYFLFYYNYALSGGYAVILALGVWILWSGIRVYTRPPSPAGLWVQVLLTSVLAGVGLWVHYLILPSLLVAAVYFSLHLVRHRFSLNVLACYAAGVAIAAFGFLPLHLMRHYLPHGPSMISSFSWTWVQLCKSVNILFTANFHRLLLWHFDHTLPASIKFIFYILIILLLLVMLFLAGLEMRILARRGKGMAVMFPALYLLFFLPMYLPHTMSIIAAPRYVFALWHLVLCTAWVHGLGFLARAGCRANILGMVLICVWLVFQVSGNVLFTRSMADGTKQRVAGNEAVIAFARKQGLESVQLVGTPLFGKESQPLSMLAENRPHFVYAGLERYQKNAQSAETDERYGILCEKREQPLVAESLRVLGSQYAVQQIGGMVMFYGFRFVPRSGQALSSAGWKVEATGQTEGQGSSLVDHVAATAAAWKEGEEGTIIIDMREPRRIDRVWLMASHINAEGVFPGLPERFSVETADGDEVFLPVLSVEKHMTGAFVNGSRIFFSDYFNLSEGVFPPVACRFVKLRFPKGQKTQLISEVMLFEAQDKVVSTTGGDAVSAIQKVLHAEHADLVISDRWLSGILMREATSEKPFPALPRFNRYSTTDESPSRLVSPRRGMVIAPALAVASECRHLLEERFGPGVIRKYEEIGQYGLLFLDDVKTERLDFPFLYWNGNMLVSLASVEDIAPLKIAGSGLAMVKPQQEKNAGFYADAWTNGDGVLQKLDLSVPEGAGYIALYIAYPAGKEYEDSSGSPEVMVNGQPLKYSHHDRKIKFFHLPPGCVTIKEIRIRSASFVPTSSDHRKLGVNVPLILVL